MVRTSSHSGSQCFVLFQTYGRWNIGTMYRMSFEKTCFSVSVSAFTMQSP
ncbi:MAG: hypothetical protein AAGG08_05970 [Actinomycetota bacterium]